MSIELKPKLTGPSLSLRPLQTSDFDALFAAASDPLIWEQHPEPLRYQRPVFANFFAGAIASGGALIVTDNATGAIIGTSRFYEWNPDTREIAIGYTFLARTHWGGGANREMKQLMLRHAFGFVDTVWFHVGRANWRSRKAMEKIGGRVAYYGAKVLNGVALDYVFYKITKA